MLAVGTVARMDDVTGPQQSGSLRLANQVAVAPGELLWRFSTAGGPGGQHVNTSNTKVELRWDIAGSPSIDTETRQRLMDRLGSVVSVTASEERSQTRNRAAAMARLCSRIEAAMAVRTPRRPTRPTRASQHRRLAAKRVRGNKKADRRARPDPED
jgi:ribosome-associated protein